MEKRKKPETLEELNAERGESEIELPYREDREKILPVAKEWQQRDTLESSTTTSPCTYAVESPCAGRYARWCERSVLYLGEPPTRLVQRAKGLCAGDGLF